MTILTVVQEVCSVIGVVKPTSLFAGIGTNRTHQELLDLANEMAQRMAYDTREWSALKQSVTLPGDGQWVPPQPDPLAVWTGTSAFNLPANYKRMLLKSEVWRSTSTQQPMRFISDFDEWQQRRFVGDTDAWGEWTMYGGQIHIWPIMAGPIAAVPGVSAAVPAVMARFSYLDKNCVVLNSGGFSDRFTNDTDSYRLDERLLKLNMIWQWKAQKGSPYAEDMGTYSDALVMAVGADSPAPIIVDRLPVDRWGRNASFW